MVAQRPGSRSGGGRVRANVAPRAPALLFVRDAHDLYLETLARAWGRRARAAPRRAARPAQPSAAGGPRACRSVGTRRIRRTSRPRSARLGLGAARRDALHDRPRRRSLIRLAGTGELTRARSRRRERALATAGLADGRNRSHGARRQRGGGRGPGRSRPRRPRDRAARGRAGAAARPVSGRALRLRGEAELAEGHLERRRGEHLRRAVRDDPGSWDAWVDLALVTRRCSTRASDRPRPASRTRSRPSLTPAAPSGTIPDSRVFPPPRRRPRRPRRATISRERPTRPRPGTARAMARRTEAGREAPTPTVRATATARSR